MDNSIDALLNSLMDEIKGKPVQRPEKFGVVLAGGGGKGAYEIGALAALKEIGVLKDVVAVSGNSIGSVNLSFIASDTLDEAKELWENIQVSDFIEFDDNGFDITKEGDGIFSREGLKRMLEGHSDFKKMSESDIHFYITVCTKDENGGIKTEYVLVNGKSPELIEGYVLASSAIPIVYDAVELEGKKYFDGGLGDNTPIKPLVDEGIKDIIVISLDSLYKIDTSKYPGVNFYTIVPSHTLEIGAVLGTVDLSKANSIYRYKLGYLDAKMIINAYLNGKAVPDLSGNHVMASQDLNRAKLKSSVDDNLAGLARILGTTDIL